MRGLRTLNAIGAWLILAATLIPTIAYDHCDGLDGPVVKAAERALESGDVKHALPWVQKADEAEVTAAFEKTIAVRKLGAEAKALADRYFFETLVRIHRAGEGEPYTGLKPAGRDLGPAIPAADKAIETGSGEKLDQLLVTSAREGINRRLAEAIEAKQQAAASPGDVQKARRAVQAYVAFLHYIEQLYNAAAAQAHHAESASVQQQHPEHR